MPSAFVLGTTGSTATNLTGLNATTGVTVAWWMRPGVETTIIAADIFTHTSTANASRSGYTVWISGSQVVVRVCGTTTSADTAASALISRPIHNQWVHYAITFDNATNTILHFRNGMLILRSPSSIDMTSNASCTTRLAGSATAGALAGNLFDVQVLPDVVVPPSDIRLLMDPGVKYPGVKGRYCGRDFRGGTTVTDESGNGNNLTAAAAVRTGEEPPLSPTLA